MCCDALFVEVVDDAIETLEVLHMQGRMVRIGVVATEGKDFGAAILELRIELLVFGPAYVIGEDVHDDLIEAVLGKAVDKLTRDRDRVRVSGIEGEEPIGLESDGVIAVPVLIAEFAWDPGSSSMPPLRLLLAAKAVNSPVRLSRALRGAVVE